MSFYSCPHIYIDGRICGKGWYQQEGCALHWKMRLRNPYKECGIPLYTVCVLNMLENIATNQTIIKKGRLNYSQNIIMRMDIRYARHKVL